MQVRQPYGEERFVPWLGRTVQPGEVAEVPDDDLASYLEAGWTPADKPTQKASAELAKAKEPPPADQQVPGEPPADGKEQS